MAEPLLKRTFSRLRGKDRSHRKTEPKVSEASLVSDVVHSSSSHSLTTSSPSPPSPPRNHITVAKIQQWARQAPPPQQSSAHRSTQPQSETSQDAPGPAGSQKLLQEKTIPVLQSSPQPVGGSSGQRAYLQSLERSSRAWLLSSGKSSEETRGPQEDTSSNIWYNPIPEEEEEAGPRREEEPVWRKREDGAELAGVWVGPSDVRQDGANPSVSHHDDNITAENTGPTPSESSPASNKKGGVSGSVMDRLRSPGTVRKLSMKMKKLPELRRKLSLRSASRAHRQGNSECREGGDEPSSRSASASALSNQNVISKYHLDSSAPPARSRRRSSRGRSANKGGYLSDGDSPELLPRQPTSPPTGSQDSACDVSSFQLYVGSNPPRCNQRVTGLLTVHLLGLDEMKTSRSEDGKEVFVAIQIDGVTRARTALLALRGATLSLNHTFHLELERARQLRIVVLTPAASLPVVGGAKPEQSSSSSGPSRNRVCGLGGVSIPPLFKGSRSQQLCVKLEPRGLLYLKLSLQESWEPQSSTDSSTPASVFGVELHHLVEKEGCAPPVPLLIQKSVTEIERRGLKVVGLYRLCGSAAVKKELRDWFERNSSAVSLSEDLYPDINVITGILKDYLRELPSPLITRTLYQVVREAMTLHPPPAPPTPLDPQLAQRTVGLLSCLPPPERATLSLLLDHLSLVASFSSLNRMTHQNLAVCFGPVLLTPSPEAWGGGGGGGGGRGARGAGKVFGQGEEMASAVDFKRHIEALHYLLQLWPVPTHRIPPDENADASPPPSPTPPHHPLGPRRPVMRLSQRSEQEVVVSRRGRGGPARLDSPPPINRYAGDWSVCGGGLLGSGEGDYDEVAASESSEDEEEQEKKELWPAGGGAGEGGAGGVGALYVDEFLDFDAPFHCRLSLKDFDTLIHDLDRELAKQINICL
ncbi:rho GTPase-activating protein SYDE1-like isoform X1 [Salarias fasciatus]|uniref:rho GTPase-activating protein SYDE1-like isoform X1 n=1 Tax=Salarias fasciatus TaxID=181472 RepID=UPI001176C549|nr:rho GTPase-activating protein SYDE1-like isoform X1 [Salarias fasciatus]